MREWTALVLMGPVVAASAADAPSRDLGNGFKDHGVCTPVSNHRGTVATADGEGRAVVLSWLYDHRGGYGLLYLDARTGKSEVCGTPYNWSGDGPFASILSKAGRYYTHFGSHFTEFDPVKRAFTAVHKTVPQMAMSMTEDDQGRIWSATYPSSGLASYDPKTGEFKDYGHLYKQNWAQYPRGIAADDAGWIYFGIGSTRSQIIAFDPATAKATPLLAENERVQAYAPVVRDRNGKVYAHRGDGQWMELYQGRRSDLPEPPKVQAVPYIAGSQGLFHKVFPDGATLAEFSLLERKVAVKEKDGKLTRSDFDYPSEGAHTMGLAAAPNGTICGGTAFPMRFFSYDPKADTWERHTALGQWNTVTALGDTFWAGAYGHGILEEWDPSQPWVDTVAGKAESNPKVLFECKEVINRPHDLLATPDGKWVVLAGTPGYGHTGGGLLIWDRQAQQPKLLKHTDILPELSTYCLGALPDGKLVAGTTIGAGTGGEVKAEVAELYLMDLASAKVEWHAVAIPGVKTYIDLWVSPAGLVYGIADRTTFFVFDPAERKIVHQAPTGDLGSSVSQQGTRCFVEGPDGRIFLLFNQGVAELNPATYALTLVVKSPPTIGGGGACLDGRIYFYNGSHLYSCEVPAPSAQAGG